MKVAFDISPVKTGHRTRGIGSYTRKLADEFRSLNQKDIKFEFFENPKSPPPADITHYPYFDLFFHTLPISQKTKRVVTIHDVIPLVFPEHFPAGIRGFINFFFQKIAIHNTDAVICDSETSKQDIAEKLFLAKKKIHVVYLAADDNFKKIDSKIGLMGVQKKYNLPREFAVYVGDVNWNKNIENLLYAIKIAKINLVMVGAAIANNNLAQTIEINKKIKKLNIEKFVQKIGYVGQNDLVAIYNLAMLTVLPSFYEGFGLPVLESMNCGTPVICSNVSSLSEIAAAAVFCDPADPSDIASKINDVLNLSQKERASLSEKSIKHASQFSWQKVIKETIDVYRSI